MKNMVADHLFLNKIGVIGNDTQILLEKKDFFDIIIAKFCKFGLSCVLSIISSSNQVPGLTQLVFNENLFDSELPERTSGSQFICFLL